MKNGRICKKDNKFMTARLNTEKITALLMFIHSRLSGKSISNTKNDAIEIFKDDTAKSMQDNSTKIIKTLTDHSFYTEYLNKLPNGFYCDMLIYYYEQCLNVINKELVHKNEQIIDQLIGYSILSYLIDEKDIISKCSASNKAIRLFYEAIQESGVSLINEISEFEKADCGPSLIRKMHYISSLIIDKVENANFTLYIKKNKGRKSKTRNRQKK